MYTTYHLKSADEINSDLLDSIKAIYKSKPITIIVEEDEDNFEPDDEMKTILDERLEESLRRIKDYFPITSAIVFPISAGLATT
jgi:hypothetical protein